MKIKKIEVFNQLQQYLFENKINKWEMVNVNSLTKKFNVSNTLIKKYVSIIFEKK